VVDAHLWLHLPKSVEGQRRLPQASFLLVEELGIACCLVAAQRRISMDWKIIQSSHINC
jgi:hypothetical protein